MTSIARMFRGLRPVWAAAAVALSLGAFALPALADAPVKIGYFDVKRILAEVDEAKSAKAKLQRDFDEKQKQLDQQKSDIEKMQKEFQAKQTVLSQQAKDQMMMEMQNKVAAAAKLYQDLQGDLAQKEQMALADLLGRLEPVVREIADQEGYTYVFEKNESGMFYGPAGHDLTAQVIRAYNQRFSGKGGGQKTASQPAQGGQKK